jgi:hypothetical protein
VLVAALAGTSQSAPFATVIGDFAREPARATPDGGPLLRILPARDREIGIAAAIDLRASSHRLIDLVTRLEHLQMADGVAAAGRFSQPPVEADLAALRWPSGDLEELRACEPGRCALKLSDEEMASIRALNRHPYGEWRPKAERALNRIVLERLEAFRARGHAGIGPYHDKRAPVALAGEFDAVLASMTYLGGETPSIVDHLRRYPNGARRPAVEFYYWAIETLGLKPVVTVTRLSVFERAAGRDCDVLIVSTQVFATHYVTASLSMMTIVGGTAPGRDLFVYANRSRVDGLQGWFGGVVRRKIEGRIRAVAPGALLRLRNLLEAPASGPQ